MLLHTCLSSIHMTCVVFTPVQYQLSLDFSPCVAYLLYKPVFTSLIISQCSLSVISSLGLMFATTSLPRGISSLFKLSRDRHPLLLNCILFVFFGRAFPVGNSAVLREKGEGASKRPPRGRRRGGTGSNHGSVRGGATGLTLLHSRVRGAMV